MFRKKESETVILETDTWSGCLWVLKVLVMIRWYG